MFILKACPRCCGDLTRQVDAFGPYIGCLQCGYILKEEEEARFFLGSEELLARERRKRDEPWPGRLALRGARR